MIEVKMILLITTLVTATAAVKINNLNVPPQYIIHSLKPEPLILDCEYDLPVDEKGFVLKWYLNDQLIYQWISNANPRLYVHNIIRNNIDLNHTSFENKHRNKHRTLNFVRPTIQMSGIYTCAVGTFQSEEKRSSHLQIIVPESEFLMDIRKGNYGASDITVECSAYHIYPEPKLMIRVGDDNEPLSELITKTEKDQINGLWDIHVSGKLSRQNTVVINPSDVHCILVIPNTTYVKQKSVSQFTNQGSQVTAHIKIATIFSSVLLTVYLQPRTNC